MILNEIKPYVDWLQANPISAGIVVGMISFLECLALVGLLFPGTVIVTAVGGLVGAGILPFADMTISIIIGAIAGDYLSFWLGYKYHERIREFWPFRSHPHILKSGENYFIKHGRKSVFFGRFVGPIRPLLPLIAGMMSMPVRSFLIADGIAAFIWAPVYLFPGILLGVASQELPPGMALKFIFLVVGILLVFWCLSWLLKSTYIWIRVTNYRLLQKLWQKIQVSPSFIMLERVLVDPAHPQSHNQLGIAILFSVAILAFIILVCSVLQHGLLTAWNHPVYYFMRSLHTNPLFHLMVGVTFLGEFKVISVMWLAVSVWLLINRHWNALIHWFSAGVIANVLGKVIKHWVHSPRPNGLLHIPPGFSFPSGHSLLSVTLFGFLAVLIAQNRSRTVRLIAYSTAAIISIAVMFSRLYLGAHWLTDVIGGALLGFCIITLLTITYRKHVIQPLSAWKVLAVAVISLAITWGVFFTYKYEENIINYTPSWSVQSFSSKTWWKQAEDNAPIYRTNRFGKPTQILNVQWAGQLTQIEQVLSQNGWTVLPKNSFKSLIRELVDKYHNEPPVLLSQFHNSEKASLIMFKIINEPQKTVLILHLWDAHMVLDNSLPLWVGLVNYHQPWNTRFIKQPSADKTPLPPLPAPIDVLAEDLNDGFTWKIIAYPNTEVTTPAAGDTNESDVLFIK